MPGIWQYTILLDSGMLVGVILSTISYVQPLYSLEYCPQLLSQLVSELTYHY